MMLNVRLKPNKGGSIVAQDLTVQNYLSRLVKMIVPHHNSRSITEYRYTSLYNLGNIEVNWFSNNALCKRMVLLGGIYYSD